MSLVAFRIRGDVPIYTFSVLVALGLLLAVCDLSLVGRSRRWQGTQVLEMIVWALVPGILVGRLGCVVAYDLGAVRGLYLPTVPWGDGLLFPAALAGGALGLAALAAWRRRPCLEFLGTAVPGLALAQALGWLGAAVHGAQAGISLPVSHYWAPQMRDLYGTITPRFPVQYAACAISLVAWLLLTRCLWNDRLRVACYALLTGGGLAVLDIWRASRLDLWAGFSPEQLGYLALALAGLVLLWGRRRPARVSGRASLTAREGTTLR